MSIIDTTRSKPKLWVSAGLLSAGLAGGLSLGTSLPSGAADTSSATTTGNASSGTPSSPSSATTPGGTSSSGTSSRGPNAPGNPPSGGSHAPAYQGLPKSGTVTSVGTDSVTIDGTVYAVTSSSDIDKNGESTLSSLAVGDKVTFSTVASDSTPTIDKLHAGSESLDRPTGGPSSSSGHGSSTGPTPPRGTPPRGTPPRGTPPARGTSPSGEWAPPAA